jgi:hypothetical protein
MKYKPLALILLLSAFMSCGPTTKMTATWRASDDGQSFKNIAVIAIAKNLEARKTVEAMVEDKLIKAGIRATAGLTFLPPNATKDNIPVDVVKQFLLVEGFDAVITISLLGKEDTRRYVSGSYAYAPAYAYSFNDYYGGMYSYIYSPGYYAGSLDIFLETNLFTWPEGELVWSGQSETYDVTNLERSADTFSDILVKEIVESKVIVP